MGVKKVTKKGTSKKAEGTSKKKSKAAPVREKKESNKGKRGSSKEKELTFKGDKKYPSRGDKPYSEKDSGEKKSYGGKKTYGKSAEGGYADDKKSYGGKKIYGQSKESGYADDKKSYGGKKIYGQSKESGYADDKKSYGGKKTYGKGKEGGYRGDDKFAAPKKDKGQGGPKQFFTSKYAGAKPADWKPKVYDGLMRLNKFLSNAGVASRRDADKLIELGLVSVNGIVVTELGHKVDAKIDVVKYDDKTLKPEPMRYVLLNKPKDYITTMDDPEERKTVMFLIKSACKERIYPVGRLDRNTTGLLLFTNDGDLAKKLTHPKHGIQKLYHVETIEKVKGGDLDAIREGVQLEDGYIKADEVSYVGDDPHHVGIRIHSGRNRIVRRIFEHYKYTIKKLDRVMFAGLTKKDLPRGRYRNLTEQEVNYLRMIQ